MGGDATAWIDCLACNRDKLSALDQAIAERSLVAFSRAAFTPSEAFDAQIAGEHFHHDVARNLFTEVKVGNLLRASPFPQIHFDIDTGVVSVVAEDKQALEGLVVFLDDRIRKGTLERVHVKVGPAEKCTTARIVMHRSRDGFMRVRKVGDEVRVYAMLNGAWPKLRADMTGGKAPAEESIKNPSIEMSVAIRIDDTFRAVAKTAFNVLAMDVGVDMALRPEFDPIRAYIIGSDIRHPAKLAEGEIAVDDRFVRQVPWGQPPLVPTDQHAVTISYQAPKLMAYVTLYREHSFIVELATITLPEAVLASREFSTVRKGNAALDIAELYERLSKRT